MFPWNYGFHFGVASYIFLGAFYTVLVVVATTILNALWRARRDLSKGKAEDKVEAMKSAGIAVADSPAALGTTLAKALNGGGKGWFSRS